MTSSSFKVGIYFAYCTWRRIIRTAPIGLKEVVLVDRGAALSVPGMWRNFRCLSPFAPAYAHYSFYLIRFFCALSRWTTLSEVAVLSHLGWDTVKDIVKSDLGKRYRMGMCAFITAAKPGSSYSSSTTRTLSQTP